MADATFYQGNPLMVDHEPSSDVAAGDVVVVGDVPFVAHRAIDSGVQGALAAGGGVYKVTSDGSVDSGGAQVFWNATAGKVTTTASGNPHFGFAVPDQGATDDGDEAKVIHAPLIATAA